MTDQFGRKIDYLRVSVTDRCNLRCVYCMPAQGVPPIPHAEILSYEELLRICRAAAGLGIRKVKLTGGEPLVRRGIASLVRGLQATEGIEQVTMTTNGILLGQLAGELKAAGLDAVNVSLDTLDPEQFAQITRRGGLKQVLESLDSALDAGLRVKLNCVPTPGNRDQILALAALAKERPLDVRFIELMPIGMGCAADGVPMAEVKCLLAREYGPLSPWGEPRGNGPAEYVSAPGFLGKLGFIGAVSGCFCQCCNRVRLTATGFLKPCLHDGGGTDLRALVRGGASDGALAQALESVIYRKPARHRFGSGAENAERHGMSQIGG